MVGEKSALQNLAASKISAIFSSKDLRALSLLRRSPLPSAGPDGESSDLGVRVGRNRAQLICEGLEGLEISGKRVYWQNEAFLTVARLNLIENLLADSGPKLQPSTPAVRVEHALDNLIKATKYFLTQDFCTGLRVFSTVQFFLKSTWPEKGLLALLPHLFPSGPFAFSHLFSALAALPSSLFLELPEKSDFQVLI